MWRWEVFWSLGAPKEPHTAPLLALGVPRRSASVHMVTPPSAMWSLGGPQRTSYSPMCFLALGALVELLLSTCYSCVHVPSIPEFLNSGMLVGVDPLPVPMGRGVLIPVLRVGSSPTSIPEFRNSGFLMCLLSLGALEELLLSHICVCLLSLGTLVELLLITCMICCASWSLVPSCKCFCPHVYS